MTKDKIIKDIDENEILEAGEVEEIEPDEKDEEDQQSILTVYRSGQPQQVAIVGK